MKLRPSARSRARASISSITISAFALALAACHGSHATRDDAALVRVAVRDAAPADAGTWAALANLPRVEPLRVIALPARGGPRFQVGGPAIAGDVAVVASSQFGFLGVDYRGGQILWSKPAGDHVAPPLVVAGSFVLVGECLHAPDVPERDVLLGCARVVTPTGADESYVAVHGNHELDGFAAATGPEHTWSTGDHRISWRRGDHAVAIDLLTGVATPTAPDEPLVVHYKDRTWEVTHDDDGVIIAKLRGREAWRTSRAYSTLIGAVYLPGQSPMLRISNQTAFRGAPELSLVDLDATGSLHGQVALPVPGIGLVGHAVDAVGDTALAVRLDPSLQRDFIAGYAANALLMWVYPLPEVPRADPIGVALAPDAVVVFHDGDTLTILPELSAPATAPGAARPPSENPTP